MSTLLAGLASAALLGTEKRTPAWPAPEGDIGALLQAIARDNPATALLRMAGVLGTCHLAGWQPQARSDGALPAPPEPPAPQQALPPSAPQETAQAGLRMEHASALNQLLASILAEGPNRLIAEALRALATSGRSLPHRLLPQALECGRRQAALTPHLLAAIGPRGVWLAGHNPAWAYASTAVHAATPDEAAPAASAPAVWERGTLEQRKQFLAALRKQDAAQARTLIAAAFETEGARERSAFIDALRITLSPADEDLLEQALRDKSKECRQSAAALLAALPGSRLQQRMAARLQACISVEKKFLRGNVATLDAPAAFDAVWKQDSIEQDKPKSVKYGERAWWLFQLTAHAPLTWWQQHLELTPAQLIEWAGKSDWKDALLHGWAVAQQRQRRADWAQAFLAARLPADVPLDRYELLDTLPAALRETAFIALWQESKGGHDHSPSVALDRFLSGIPMDRPSDRSSDRPSDRPSDRSSDTAADTSADTAPLSPEAARQLLQLLKKRVNQGSARHDWPLRASLAELACVLPAELFDECTDGWLLEQEHAAPFAESITRMGVILGQRRQLLTL